MLSQEKKKINLESKWLACHSFLFFCSSQGFETGCVEVFICSSKQPQQVMLSCLKLWPGWLRIIIDILQSVTNSRKAISSDICFKINPHNKILKQRENNTYEFPRLLSLCVIENSGCLPKGPVSWAFSRFKTDQNSRAWKQRLCFRM